MTGETPSPVTVVTTGILRGYRARWCRLVYPRRTLLEAGGLGRRLQIEVNSDAVVLVRLISFPSRMTQEWTYEFADPAFPDNLYETLDALLPLIGGS